jgi:HD-GYP domain-containing protein (c-di-GMP phosphodiesterase class II)
LEFPTVQKTIFSSPVIYTTLAPSPSRRGFGKQKTIWSDAERERARLHTYYTERVLFLAPPFVRAAPIARAHHERLDGTGYHRGIANERIAVSALILAVAEIYKALQEERPYRSALTMGHAKDTLRRLVRDGGLASTVVDCVTATPNPKKLSF